MTDSPDPLTPEADNLISIQRRFAVDAWKAKEIQALLAENARLTATLRALTEERDEALRERARWKEEFGLTAQARNELRQRLTSLEGAIRAKAEAWEQKADRYEADGQEMARDAGVGVVHPAEWEASRLRDCASEVRALLTPSAGSASPTPGEAQ